MFETLTSTQLARLIHALLVLAAALVLTAAQLRVIAAPRVTLRRYAVAWTVATAILAAVAIYLDTAVGLTAPGDRALDAIGAAVLVAVGLLVGRWWTGRAAWRGYSRPVAVASLLVIEALIALAALSFR